MISAFKRLIFIAIGAIFITALGLGVLRGIGLTRNFAPLNHPALAKPEKKVRLNISRDAQFDLKEKDNAWQVSQDSQSQSLDEFLSTFKTNYVYLNLLERDPKGLPRLLEKIKTDAVILHTPFPLNFKYLRKQRPEWLFVANEIKWTQLQVMASLFIEPIAVIDEDIFIVPQELDLKRAVNQRVLKELKRRQKVILLETSAKPSIDATPTNLPDWASGAMIKKSI